MNEKLHEVKETDQFVKNWAMAVHLSAFTVFLGLPFFNVIGPFIIWIVHKEKYSFVNKHGCESLNFQMFISVICFPLVILFFIPVINWLIYPLAFGIVVFAAINIVRASLAARNGFYFKYPFKIRVFSD